jgi:hypothetical protein
MKALTLPTQENSARTCRLLSQPGKPRAGAFLIMKRQPITKKLRFAVLSRDGFKCRYCGGEPPDVKLVIDHFIAVAKGGTGDIENLITSCQPCNAGKSDRPIAGTPSVQDGVQRAEALLADQNESAKAIRRAMKRHICARQDVVDFWCSASGRASVDKGTISVICRYVEEFGPDLVFGWIQRAADKCHSDQSMGRYVSGCRRCHKEDIAK